MASEDKGFKSVGNGLVMEVDNNIELGQVILSPDNKRQIDEFLNEQTFKEEFIKHGLAPMNRLLFYGDSGCGKTYLGKALSHHLGYRMLYVDIGNAIASGNVAQNIAAIFNEAKEENCLIFLDEVDGIAWSRDGNDIEGGDSRRALNSLFQHLDQMSNKNLVVAATNMLHRLDPAFRRRFDIEMHFLRPERNLKDTVLKFIDQKSFIVIDNVGKTTEEIVSRRAKLSYHAVKQLAQKEMKKAIMNKTMTIETAKLFEDIAIHQKIKLDFESTK